jgi:hypothetical protein
MLLGDLLEDVGLGRRRGDAVDQDATLREFLAQRLGQRHESCLGGAISRRVRVAFLAGNRSDADDAAVFLGDHPRHDGAAAQERTGEVDLDHLAPVLRRVLPHRFVWAVHAGIVHQNVDLTHLADRGVRRGCDRLGVGDVDGRGMGFADGGQVFHGGVERRRVDIPQADLRS